MTTTRDRWTAEQVLAAFDEHLRRTRGLCAGTRRNYERYAQAFLVMVFANGLVDVAAIQAGDVVGFVGDLTGRYQPRTVELAASALRSFFRFLRADGLRTDRLEDAVPMVPHRPSALVRHLAPGQLGPVDRIAGFRLAARAAGPGDHLVHGPAGAAGRRGRAAAAGRSRLAQRHRAGAGS